MNQYVNQIKDALLFPTTQGRCRQLKRCHINPVFGQNTHGTSEEAVQESGFQFLNRLRDELKLGPTPEDIEFEMDILEEKLKKEAPKKAERPTLTREYLMSLGRQDLAEWGARDCPADPESINRFINQLAEKL
jgi:hypothetical protein